jgi:hypothetical protein
MFVKSKDYQNYIHTQRINLGAEFEKEDEEVFVILREMDTKSVLKLKNSASKKDENGNPDETASLETFREILPTLIVDHNFYIDEQTKMSPDEVTELFFEKISTVSKVLSALQNRNFFR